MKSRGGRCSTVHGARVAGPSAIRCAVLMKIRQRVLGMKT